MTSLSSPQCHNFLIVIDRGEFQKHSKKYLKNGASTKDYKDFIDYDDRLDTLDDVNLENQDSKRKSQRNNSNATHVAQSDKRRRSDKTPTVKTKATKQHDEEKPPTKAYANRKAPVNRAARVQNRAKVSPRSAASRRLDGYLNTQVDANLLISVKEMAQRKKLKEVPENPKDLCQPLKIVLEDLSLEDGDRPLALDEDQLQMLIQDLSDQQNDENDIL